MLKNIKKATNLFQKLNIKSIPLTLQKQSFNISQNFSLKQLYSSKQTINIFNFQDDEHDNQAPNFQDNNSNSNDPNNQQNNNNNPKNQKPNNNPLNQLKTIPLKNWKDNDLTEEEKKIQPDTHIIFSSQLPILPYQKIPCDMQTGKLTSINHDLAYFILSDQDNIYQIGLELEKSAAKTIQKQFTKNKETSSNNILSQQKISLELQPKKLSHRVKIIELQVTDNGIYGKTIPYKDDKKSLKALQKFNLQKEMVAIRNAYFHIKKSVSYEKIEISGPQEIETIDLSTIVPDQVDKIIFQVISGTQVLFSRYIKENMNVLIQSILQSKSLIERVLFLRQHLESLMEIMEIVNRNFKQADEALIRMQYQARARYAMEYIKQIYLNDQKQNQGTQYSGGGGGAGNIFAGDRPSQTQKQSDVYMKKLDLIEDAPSKEKIRQEIERFAQLDKNSNEYHKISTYLDEVFSVPWNKYTPANWNIQYAKNILNNEIYGLDKVKERIIEMIAVNQIKNSHAKSKGFILLLQGPPGTGKTSIAKSVAKALQKESRFISFAGISDPSFFKGHRRTYVDSQPGVFVKELIKAQTMNPVFILDEIDKISRSSMGADPYYSLMEILNPEENSNFTDHYMDIKIDFSNTIFILTANNIINMLEPLKNRLEIIDIPAYIEEEKIQIAQKYIIPKALKVHGINQKLLKLDEETISFIIKNWCYDEPGVRGLKRCFETLFRKYAVELLQKNPQLSQIQQIYQQQDQEKEKELQSQQQQQQSQQQLEKVEKQEKQQNIEHQTILTDQNLNQLNLPVLDLTHKKDQLEQIKKYLGVPVFDAENDSRLQKRFPPGVVNILSVAGFVGHVMKIECVYDLSQLEKKGTFSSSGNLQQVLQESLTIAKINAFNFLSEEQKKSLSQNNIHIHFMSGAVPKDGPSAGIAICTAYLSLAMGIQVPANLAMTGELSPLGEVCKIGGLLQKVIGAKSLNIDTIICPYSNMSDIHEFPKILLEGLTIYFVKEYKQVYGIVFENKRGGETGVVILKDGKFTNQQDENINITNQNNNDVNQNQKDSINV